MALPKYQEYLAAQVLNEGRPVNYRLLSRAFGIPNNVAKQILFEFHRAQATRKPNSIHATYLFTGKRRSVDDTQAHSTNKKDDEDVTMKDEPLMSSSMPEAEDENENMEDTPLLSITLVQEEHLEDVKHLYSVISSVHIYSLEPGPLQNVQLLSDCARRVDTEFAAQDPLETWKEHGVIGNPHAKRRNARAVPPAPPVSSTTAGMKAVPNKQSATPIEGVAKASKQPPSTKRESSDLFKSFAKTRPATSASKASDEPMLDADDDEDESFAEFADKANAEAQAKARVARQARSDREEKLKQMMEEQEEEAADNSDQERDADVDMEEPSEAEPEIQDANPPPETEQVTTANGRRRGRRRVMKKKTTKDAEGYLVTKEEAAWESFSEDEQPAPAPVQVQGSSSTKTASSSNKSANKKGQGNIMNFFAKK